VRRRLVISTIAIVLVVLGALAYPIGQVVYDAADKQLQLVLEERATSIAAAYTDDLSNGREPNYSLIHSNLGPSDRLVIRNASGEEIHSFGPIPTSPRAPVIRTGFNGASITVSTDADPLDANFRRQLNILLALALGALAAAAALAAVQARQLARPLERLAARAGRIGEGDFSVQPFTHTNIPEIDHIGSSLESSAQRVDVMLANERHFTADATHQLRTGIAGIAMRLEILSMNPDPAVSQDASAGLAQTDQLNATIDELLALARNRSTNERKVFDLETFVGDHVAEWKPRFAGAKRHISTITSSSPPPVMATLGLAGQVIDILIDNSLRHGSGAVTLMVDGPSVTIIDQGAGVEEMRLRTMFDGPVDPAARHGRGLPLARRLAQVDGAALDVVGNRPLRIRFQLVRAESNGNGELVSTGASLG
jgi:signal transduction histidine kinase